MKRPGPRPARRAVAAALTLAAIGAALTACGSSRSGASAAAASGGAAARPAPSGTVSLVAYSTPKPAYAKLIAAFQHTSQGRQVSFQQSYGASGSQATAVADGLPADVVNFSLQPDMAKLVKAGLVSQSWDAGADKGIVTDSVVVFVVRKGNPKGIHSWSDLVRPGVKVVTPNPFASGSARWNVLAAYGAALKQGDTPAQAQDYLKQLLSHVAVQPSSAATALTTFLGGTGDVLLDYEDDAIAAQRAGEPVSYVVPAQTILIENPIATVTGSKQPAAAKAFVDFLLSPAGQKIWGQQGYRPVDKAVAAQFHFPQPAQLFDISYLGGWTSATNTFFDPTSGAITKIEQSLGVSTAKG